MKQQDIMTRERAEAELACLREVFSEVRLLDKQYMEQLQRHVRNYHASGMIFCKKNISVTDAVLWKRFCRKNRIQSWRFWKRMSIL